MLREVFFGHRLICRNILPIYEVLLPHLQLPLSLSLLKHLHISGRSGRHGVEIVFVRGFIPQFIITEIEMSLPQLMLHLDIILTCIPWC